MLIKTDGIVIREKTTGERDRLLTLLTRSNGVIHAFANGARSMKSSSTGATSLLCYSDFSINKGKNGSYTIREAIPKEVFFGLRSDIIKLSLAQYFAEIAEDLSPKEEEAHEFLRIILNGLYFIGNSKKDINFVKAVTELRLLTLSGFMPGLVACDNCGCYESEKMFFSIRNGKLWCENCVPTEKAVTVSAGVVAAMRHICFSDFDKIYSFKISKDGVLALSAVSENYLRAVTSRNYKTLDFYKTMTEY